MRPGLKQHELSKCAVCSEGVAHNNDLTFYRITIEMHVINVGAVQRQTGLEMFLNSAVLAGVMGPDEAMSVVLNEVRPAMLCFNCALKYGVVQLNEMLTPAESES